MTPKNGRPDENYSKAVLARQAESLYKELACLQSDCCEKSIHDTRVQSRRMRAALEAFRDLFNPDPYRALYRTVKQITRTLGKPRETGVILKLLRELGDAGDMAEGVSREYLVEKMENKLQKQEKRLLRNLKTLDPLQLQSQMQFLLASMDLYAAKDASKIETAGQTRTSMRKRIMEMPFQQTLFGMHETDRDRALRIFKELAPPILAFRARYHFHRATDDKLHELRISAKKLRYAMELFAPIWPHGLKEKIADARALQDAGGLYHDWCVLCATLKEEIGRTHEGDNAHLAFQIGRLLAFAEDRKAELRREILPAINALQSTLQALLASSVSEPEHEAPHIATEEFIRK